MESRTDYYNNGRTLFIDHDDHRDQLLLPGRFDTESRFLNRETKFLTLKNRETKDVYLLNVDPSDYYLIKTGLKTDISPFDNLKSDTSGRYLFCLDPVIDRDNSFYRIQKLDLENWVIENHRLDLGFSSDFTHDTMIVGADRLFLSVEMAEGQNVTRKILVFDFDFRLLKETKFYGDYRLVAVDDSSSTLLMLNESGPTFYDYDLNILYNVVKDQGAFTIDSFTPEYQHYVIKKSVSHFIIVSCSGNTIVKTYTAVRFEQKMILSQMNLRTMKINIESSFETRDINGNCFVLDQKRRELIFPNLTAYKYQ